MGNILKLNNPVAYSLKTRQELYSRNPKTVKYGKKTISFWAPNIWAIVSQNIKNCTSLSSFKINTREWKPVCSCELDKYFLKHVLIKKFIKSNNLQIISTSFLVKCIFSSFSLFVCFAVARML